jgi:hypothetical protein
MSYALKFRKFGIRLASYVDVRAYIGGHIPSEAPAVVLLTMREEGSDKRAALRMSAETARELGTSLVQYGHFLARMEKGLCTCTVHDKGKHYEVQVTAECKSKIHGGMPRTIVISSEV